MDTSFIILYQYFPIRHSSKTFRIDRKCLPITLRGFVCGTMIMICSSNMGLRSVYYCNEYCRVLLCRTWCLGVHSIR